MCSFEGMLLFFSGGKLCNSEQRDFIPMMNSSRDFLLFVPYKVNWMNTMCNHVMFFSLIFFPFSNGSSSVFDYLWMNLEIYFFDIELHYVPIENRFSHFFAVDRLVYLIKHIMYVVQSLSQICLHLLRSRCLQ